MLCNRCHHADLIHASPKKTEGPFSLGMCSIPGCTCKSYVDSISKIDEELV